MRFMAQGTAIHVKGLPDGRHGNFYVVGLKKS